MNGLFMVSRGVRDVFLSESELRQQARRGLLAPQDRVYHPLLGRWLYAREVAEVEQDLASGAALGRRPPPESVVLVPVNGHAVAGLILAVLGVVPGAGLVCAGLGLWFSAWGLGRSQTQYGSGYRLAVGGVVVSLLCLVMQLAAATLLLAH